MDTKRLPTECALKSITSLVGTKTISNAYAFRPGSFLIIQLAFSDSTSAYIKVGPHGGLTIGPTNEPGEGTKVSW